jgi:hypothetical protein
MTVVTFGSISIFTVPNKLGTDAEKILDHRLFNVNTVRETSA